MKVLFCCVMAAAATASANALAAPAQTAIHYTFSDRYDVDIWTGPTGNPIQAYGGNGGPIDVTVSRNADGSYGVQQRMRDVNGEATWDSTYQLVRDGTRTLETLAAQSGTYRSSGLVRRTVDTYPDRRIAFALPLRPPDVWSAAAHDELSLSLVQTNPSPFRERETTDREPDGRYSAQVTASGFTSSTDVRQFSASTYRLSKAGFNTLTQTFALPVNGIIDVTSAGTPPLPVKPGTVKIASWYPYAGGALTRPLQRDAFRVAGPAKMPALCGPRAHQAATQVDEDGYSVDPVRGTASAFATTYYLSPLAGSTLFVACVTERYAAAVWANGWAMSAGNWGKLTLDQAGERLYIAGRVSAGADAASRFARLPVIGIDAIAMRRVLGWELATPKTYERFR